MAVNMTAPSLSLPSPIDGAIMTNVSTTLTPTFTPTSTMAALSEDELFDRLVKYNDDKARLYIPVMVYMSILTVVGTFGNILVMCVYCCKPTKTSSHFFILALAVLDLLTCLIGMPTEITDLRFPYMFHASAACKLLRFTESVTTIGSSMILIAVAVDRYLRICKLGRMISVDVAQRICIAALFVGMAISWPACLLFGRSTTDLEPGFVGVDCSTDDSMRHTIYPSIYYGFLGLLFICCITFFSVIYCKIGLQIWRQKKAKIGENGTNNKGGRTFSNSTTRESHSSVVITEDQPADHGSDPISTEMSSENMEEQYAKKRLSKDRRVSSVSQTTMKAKRRRSSTTIKVTRTTVVLFAVTVAYIISFLPFLIIMTLRSINRKFESSLSPGHEVAIKFCLKSYFINNAINPLIYSFLNMKFRKDAAMLLRRVASVCCCCRRTDPL